MEGLPDNSALRIRRDFFGLTRVEVARITGVREYLQIYLAVRYTRKRERVGAVRAREVKRANEAGARYSAAELAEPQPI